MLFLPLIYVLVQYRGKTIGKSSRSPVPFTDIYCLFKPSTAGIELITTLGSASCCGNDQFRLVSFCKLWRDSDSLY